ncbi:MAG: OmpP1/FadL family transporter [Lentisphaerota bacterium]
MRPRISRFESVALVMLSCLVLSPSVFAAGFALYEGSARGNAMGGSLIAIADDPSALYYNPAGITQLEGMQVMGGATFITPSTDVETLTPMGKVTAKSVKNTWIPPHLYATYGMTEKVWMGLGVSSRFGLGSEFDENWAGRYNSYKAIIQTLDFNPNLALKINDQVSVAAGFSVMWFDLELDRKLPNPVVGGPDMDFSLTGDSFGYGFNVAGRYEVTKWMALGLTYKSRVKQSIDGTADIKVSNTGAEGDITLPDMLSGAVAFKPMKKMNVELGVVYTGWKTYDELAVTFDTPEKIGSPVKTSVSPKNWDNVFRYQAGVEYGLTDNFDVRLGYVYDQSPIPDETADYLVPADGRQIFNTGIGYHNAKFRADLSYSYLLIKDWHIPARPAAGVFDSEFTNGDAHMIGATVAAAF